MRLGIFARTFPGAAPMTVLAAAKAAGFDTAQYNMACSGLASMPEAIAPDVAGDIAEAAKANELPLCAVSGTYNMAHPDPAVRADGLRRLEVIAVACARMGANLVTLCTGTRDPLDQWRHHPDNATAEAWRDMRREMEKAAAIAERLGLKLGIEPELANIVDSAAKARRLIDELKSPALTIVLDPANLFERVDLTGQRRIVADAVSLLADRIAMGHAKDRSADGAFVAAGKGVIDYPHYLNCLRAAGFDGDLVTHGLSPEEAPEVAGFLRGLIT